jgi:hypothetical protein
MLPVCFVDDSDLIKLQAIEIQFAIQVTRIDHATVVEIEIATQHHFDEARPIHGTLHMTVLHGIVVDVVKADFDRVLSKLRLPDSAQRRKGGTAKDAKHA